MAFNVNINVNADEMSNYKSPSYACQMKLVEKFLGISSDWNPFQSTDWDEAGPPGPLASSRIKSDLTSLFKEPLPGIFAIPDESNFCLVHCLVLGPSETPYEGGFFHFAVRFGPSYPIQPPRVQLMTTGAGQVRFNPNLYEDGKVCLSILGTWAGPEWSPASNLGSLLLSIQSLLNEKPCYNEPCFKQESYEGQSDDYNLYLTHEMIRVSVCDQLENYCNSAAVKLLPTQLSEIMKKSFIKNYEKYIDICNKNKKYDGQKLKDIYMDFDRKAFNFENLLKRLEKLKDKFSSLPKTEDEQDEESSLSGQSDEDEENRTKKSDINAITNKFKQLTTDNSEAEEGTTTIYDELELFYDDDYDYKEDEEEEMSGLRDAGEK